MGDLDAAGAKPAASQEETKIIFLMIRQLAQMFAYEAVVYRPGNGTFWNDTSTEWESTTKETATYQELPYSIQTGYYEGTFLPDLLEGEPLQIFVRDSRSKAETALIDVLFDDPDYPTYYLNYLILRLHRPGQPSPINLWNPLPTQTVFQIPRDSAWSQDVRFINCPDLTDATTVMQILDEDETIIIETELTLTPPAYQMQPYTATLSLTLYETALLELWQYTMRIISTLETSTVVELVPSATVAVYQDED